MTQDEIIEMTRQAGGFDATPKFLQAFAKLVAQHEREACAKVAEKSWQEFRDTKDAHERLSPAPFKLENFGFNQLTIQQSQIIADNIRARGQA
jgi:hypothetical protein